MNGIRVEEVWKTPKARIPVVTDSVSIDTKTVNPRCYNIFLPALIAYRVSQNNLLKLPNLETEIDKPFSNWETQHSQPSKTNSPVASQEISRKYIIVFTKTHN
jgi:hypothetical protein